jgi:SAM-dependent methyltransferase
MRELRALAPDARRRAVTVALPSLLCGGLLLPVSRAAQAQRSEAEPPRPDVVYVPTPQPVVDGMLEIAKVGPKDMVYDLGCGDGRIVVTAARDRGARGVGIDIDPQRIAEARQNAEAAGVTKRVEFLVADLFKSNFSRATVVTLYLLPQLNERLRPQLWRQLKVGTRVVSHAFDMGEAWPHEHTEQVAGKTVYSWTIRPQHKRAA